MFVRFISFVIINFILITKIYAFSPQDDVYKNIVQNAQNFIQSFDKETQTKIILPLNDPYHKSGFCYVLQHCPNQTMGIRLGELTPLQLHKFNDLLLSLLSSNGYLKTIGVLNLENLLTQIEDKYRKHPELFEKGHGENNAAWSPPPKRSSENYYIAFFGDMRHDAKSPWALRIEGHHLTLNYSFKYDDTGKLQISVAPFFFGASPMTLASIEEKSDKELGIDKKVGQSLLRKEALWARKIIHSLTPSQASQGKWDDMPTAILAGGTDVPDATLHHKGIDYKALTQQQQQWVHYILNEFLSIHTPDLTSYDEKKLFKNAKIAWNGEKTGLYVPSYFRIESPEVLIEILQTSDYNTNPKTFHNGKIANHIHSVFRDIKNDWDYNVLGNHYKYSKHGHHHPHGEEGHSH